MGHKINDMVDTGGFPLYLVKNLIENVDVPYFIESGTAGGESIIKASKHFKHCYTIELIEGRAIVNPDIENITWYTGHSVGVLAEIIEELIIDKESLQKPKKPEKYNYALFFLDAHYSDNVPNESEYKECYILEEIQAMARYRDDSIIIIDDARLFMGHPPAPNNPQDWAGIQDIFISLKEHFPYNYSTIIDDYIVSVPERIRDYIDEDWRKNFNKRYPSEKDKLQSEVKNVWKALTEYVK